MSTLFPYAAPSVNEFVITWLTGITGNAASVGMQRPSGAVLPYRMVNRVAAHDDKVFESSTVSVHTFAASMDVAESESRITHNRMLSLGPPIAAQQQVTISGGQVVQADCVDTVQGPTWFDYEDETVWRFMARYTVDLRFVAST